MSDEPQYPEHEKMQRVMDQSQAIGEFLENAGYVLAEYVTPEGYSEPVLLPVSKSITTILAEYFNIDLGKIEAEKRQMLERLRSLGAGQ